MTTFTDIAQQPIRQVIKLLEIDIPKRVTTWINYAPGIYFIQFYKSKNATASSGWPLSYYYTNQDDEEIKNVGSCIVDGDYLIKTTAYSALVAQDESFYFSRSEQRLYVHLDEFGPPLGQIIYMGIIEGYATRTDPVNGAYWNDVEYEGRIKSIPNQSMGKDPQFYGMQTMTPVSIALGNKDGKFDFWHEEKILYGQPIRILVGFAGMAYEDYYTSFTGYIEDYDWSFDDFVINAQDRRKRLSRKIPFRRYTIDDYPYLKDENNGKLIPLRRGSINRIEPVILNETESASSYTFHFMDMADDITPSDLVVYVDGSVVTPESISYAAGTFTLASSVCQSDGDFLAVTCSFSAGDHDGKTILLEIMDTYGDTVYNSTNYNTTEVAAASSRDVQINITEATEIKDVLKKIVEAIDGFWYPQGDGRYTLRTWDEDRTPRCTIEDEEWFGGPKVSNPSNEFLSSCVIKYNKNQAAGTFSVYVNNTYEAESAREHKLYKDKEVETVIVDDDDAIAMSETIMSRSKQILKTVKRNAAFKYIDLEIMDFVIVGTNRVGTAIKQYFIAEVIGIDKGGSTIPLTLKYVKDYAMVDLRYALLVDNEGNNLVDDEGNYLMAAEVA